MTISMEEIERLRVKVAQCYENAKTCQREGAGTHRNVGDAGRVAALWAESKRDLDAALRAMEISK